MNFLARTKSACTSHRPHNTRLMPVVPLPAGQTTHWTSRHIQLINSTPTRTFAVVMDKNFHFIPLRLHVMQRAVLRRHFRPSVRLSVKCQHCDKTKCPYSYTTRKIVHLSFLRGRVVSGGRPYLSEILTKTDPCTSRTVHFRQLSLSKLESYSSRYLHNFRYIESVQNFFIKTKQA